FTGASARPYDSPATPRAAAAICGHRSQMALACFLRKIRWCTLAVRDRLNGKHGASLVIWTRFLGMSPKGEIAGPQSRIIALVARKLSSRYSRDLHTAGTKPMPRLFYRLEQERGGSPMKLSHAIWAGVAVTF